MARSHPAVACDGGWRRALPASAAIAVALILLQQHRSFVVAGDDSRREVGLALQAYRDRGYTMVVSQAGLLPFYSGWRAIDAWGLNDAEIARVAGSPTSISKRSHPALINVHV